MPTKVFDQYACFLVAGGLYILLQQPVSVAQFHQGWNYAIDSPNDSLGTRPDESIQAGGTIYEIFNMSFKDDIATDSIWFAVSANLPLYGNNLANPFLSVDGQQYPVPDSNIAWGDLILDFSGGGTLKAASNANQLFGIKFAINNNSLVPTLGVYSGASVASVTTTNAGFASSNMIFGFS
ncbi:XDD3 family exosortase-dependent surface protein [Leptolyngbyaceae cyanobacterium UHCC 1019]